MSSTRTRRRFQAAVAVFLLCCVKIWSLQALPTTSNAPEATLEAPAGHATQVQQQAESRELPRLFREGPRKTSSALVNQHALLQVDVSIVCTLSDEAKASALQSSFNDSANTERELDMDNRWFLLINELPHPDLPQEASVQLDQTFVLRWSQLDESHYRGNNTMSFLIPLKDATNERTLIVSLMEHSHENRGQPRITARRLANLPRVPSDGTKSLRSNPLVTVGLHGSTTTCVFKSHVGDLLPNDAEPPPQKKSRMPGFLMAFVGILVVCYFPKESPRDESAVEDAEHLRSRRRVYIADNDGSVESHDGSAEANDQASSTTDSHRPLPRTNVEDETLSDVSTPEHGDGEVPRIEKPPQLLRIPCSFVFSPDDESMSDRNTETSRIAVGGGDEHDASLGSAVEEESVDDKDGSASEESGERAMTILDYQKASVSMEESVPNREDGDGHLVSNASDMSDREGEQTNASVYVQEIATDPEKVSDVSARKVDASIPENTQEVTTGKEKGPNVSDREGGTSVSENTPEITTGQEKASDVSVCEGDTSIRDNTQEVTTGKEKAYDVSIREGDTSVPENVEEIATGTEKASNALGSKIDTSVPENTQEITTGKDKSYDVSGSKGVTSVPVNKLCSLNISETAAKGAHSEGGENCDPESHSIEGEAQPRMMDSLITAGSHTVSNIAEKGLSGDDGGTEQRAPESIVGTAAKLDSESSEAIKAEENAVPKVQGPGSKVLDVERVPVDEQPAGNWLQRLREFPHDATEDTNVAKESSSLTEEYQRLDTRDSPTTITEAAVVTVDDRDRDAASDGGVSGELSYVSTLPPDSDASFSPINFVEHQSDAENSHVKQSDDAPRPSRKKRRFDPTKGLRNTETERPVDVASRCDTQVDMSSSSQKQAQISASDSERRENSANVATSQPVSRKTPGKGDPKPLKDSRSAKPKTPVPEVVPSSFLQSYMHEVDAPVPWDFSSSSTSSQPKEAAPTKRVSAKPSKKRRKGPPSTIELLDDSPKSGLRSISGDNSLPSQKKKHSNEAKNKNKRRRLA